MTGHDYRGFFLVVDGIDGSGKTTVCDGVDDLLNNLQIPTLLTREPTDNEVGALIRKILRKELAKPSEDAMAHLFVADRMLHVELEILPALEEGRVVICDRYSASTVAYQGSEPGRFLWSLDLHKKVLPADLMVIMDPPLEVALGRTRSRNRNLVRPDEVYEHTEKLEKAKKRFQDLCAPGTYGVCGLAHEGILLSEDYRSSEIPAQAIVDQVLRRWRR